LKSIWEWTLVTVFGAIIGGFIAGWIGLLFSSISQRRQAKLAFLVTPSELKHNPLFVSNPKQFRAANLEQLRAAVAKVTPFLKSSRRVDLSDCWDLYQQINPDNLENSYGRAVARKYLEALGKDVGTDPAKILPLIFKKFEDIIRS